MSGKISITVLFFFILLFTACNMQTDNSNLSSSNQDIVKLNQDIDYSIAGIVTKILWVHPQDGKVRLWNINADGTKGSVKDYGVMSLWQPINCADNKILWVYINGTSDSSNGQVDYWTVDAKGNKVKGFKYGPYSLDAVNCAEDKILWYGPFEQAYYPQIALWRVDSNGNISNYQYDLPNEWKPVNYADNKIILVHTSGKIDIWTVNADGAKISNREYTDVPAGFNPVNYSDLKLLWTNSNGNVRLWIFDTNGNVINTQSYNISGFKPIYYVDGKLLWGDNNGNLTIWILDANGNKIGEKKYGPYSGWKVVNYSAKWW